MQTPTLNPAQVQVGPQPKYTITEKDKKRQKRIAAAIQAYEGDLPPPLKKTPDGIDPNVLSNRCQPIVDKGVEFLFGKELGISAGQDAQDDAQAFLDKTWGRKETRIPLLQKWAMNGAFAGRAFLRVVPERNGTFRLIPLDAATVCAQTDPQDCETVLLYCIEYCVDEQINGRPGRVFYREEISRIDPDDDGDDGNPFADVDATWEIQHWSRIGDRGFWTPTGDPIVWSYPFPPIFSNQNLPKQNDFWGYPDVTPDLIGMNKSLNLEQSCISLTEILYGQPILYSTGTGEQVIDVQPGRIIGLPLSESKIVAVNITSDVGNALAFANNIRSDMDEQSGVPGVATGRIADIPRGTVSGIALELLFMPLIKKTDKKRCLYGECIIDVSQALLVLNGMSGDIDIELGWQSPLPDDNLQDLQGAVVKKELDISTTTLQRELGYNPEEEAELRKQEDAQKQAAFAQGQGMPPALPGALPGAPPLPGQLPATPPLQGGQTA